MNWRTNNSFVVQQGPCDAKGCESSDAKTLYSDGHSYCFSCNTYFPAEHRRPMQAPYEVKKDNTDFYPTRLPVSKDNCGGNYRWLKEKYQLTDEEIDEHFFYAPVSNRHVFTHKDTDTGNEFFEARSINPFTVPKSTQYGIKPTLFMGALEISHTLVLVEDIVSAIKVGRQYGAMPLFGSFLSPSQMAQIGRIKGLERVIVWLDCDKYIAGMKYAKDIGIIVPSVAIQTYEDPKYFNDDVIAHIVENAIEALEVT